MNTRVEKGGGGARTVVAGAEQRAPERWELDETHSRLAFKLHHLVVSQIAGSFERCGGTLFLDREQPSLSSVHLWVDLASIDTGSPERDAHIRSEELLDVTRFPRATFQSTTVEIRGNDVVVNGRLDLHGMVRDIEVAIRPAALPLGVRPGQREKLSATARINRQAFGLHWNQDLDVGGVVVGDEVAIEAHVEVVRAADGS